MQTCIIYVYIYCTFIDIPRSSTAPLKFPFIVIFALKEYMNIVSGNFEPYSPEIAYAKEPYATTCISRYSLALSLSTTYTKIAILSVCIARLPRFACYAREPNEPISIEISKTKTTSTTTTQINSNKQIKLL